MPLISKIAAALVLIFVVRAFADAPALTKSIELEWEAVENAFGYEVQLTPKAGGTAITFKTVEPQLTQEVPVGVYNLRIRARHKEFADHWSAWSDAMTVEVLSKDLNLEYPKDGTVLKSASDAREEVRFEWTAVDQVKEYTLKIWTEETKDDPITFVTRKNSQRLKLIPSKVYFWQVTFESSSKVSYVQQAKTASFILEGPKLVEPSIKPFAATEPKTSLTWSSSEKTKEYKATLNFRFLDEQAAVKKKEILTKETKWEFGKLKPGVYKLEVIATAPRHANSDPGVYEFQIKPTEAEVTQALATY
jgi:hypothetical protein